MSRNVSLHMYSEKEGDNFYSRSSPYTTIVYEKILGSLKQVMSNHPIVSEDNITPFTIVDYGTSDGLSFLSILPQITDYLREVNGPDKQVFAVLVDRPENDFKAIFQNAAPFAKLNKVFISAVGSCFFGQCLPDNSLDIVICSTALHYIKELPCQLDKIFPMFSDDVTQLKCVQTVQNDLELFILQREKEMKKGGHMILETLGKDNQNRTTGYARENTISVFKLIHSCWENLHCGNVITKAEKEAAACPIVLNLTKEDVEHIFTSETRPLTKTNLKLVSVEDWTVCASHYSEFEAKKDTKEAQEEYSTLLLEYVKSWTFNVFLSALENNRSPKESDNIMDKLYSNMQKIIYEDPHSYIFDFVLLSIVIQKLP